jgi:hypothetical protein
MAIQHIFVKQSFNAPIERVFDDITDHENYGRIVKVPIVRIRDSDGDNKNGVGCVRLVTALPMSLGDVEETVITFEPHRLMEYRITKGGFAKYQKARLEFSQENGQTVLCFTVDIEPKLAIFDWLVKKGIGMTITKGLKGLAESYG